MGCIIPALEHHGGYTHTWFSMCIADDVANVLRAHPAVKAAWLFGSVARGQAGPESDVDLAVLGDAPLATADKMQLIEQLAQTCLRPVDLIDLQASRGLIVRQVLKNGRRLFCDDTTLYAELMKRWVFDQADWMPYRRRALEERREAWIKH